MPLCGPDLAAFDRMLAGWLRVGWDDPPAQRPAECDRCPAPPNGVEALGVDDDQVALWLCDHHADALLRDVLSWSRDARLVDVQPVQLVLDIRRPEQQCAAPGRPQVEPVRMPQPSPYFPTQASIAAMQRLGVSWVALVEELRRPVATRPSRRDDVTCYLTQTYSVLVGRDGAVVGLALRDPDRADQLAPRQTMTTRSKPERKGKRGGIGNVKPRTVQDILALVEATPGWTATLMPNGHYRIEGPDGRRAQIAQTPSDYRTPVNDYARLRRLGLATA